jgi:uncharacterized membrane protein
VAIFCSSATLDLLFLIIHLFCPFQALRKEVNRVYDQIYAIVYGHCVGDAIGLLTETLTKEEAKKVIYTLKLKNKSCKTFQTAGQILNKHMYSGSLTF